MRSFDELAAITAQPVRPERIYRDEKDIELRTRFRVRIPLKCSQDSPQDQRARKKRKFSYCQARPSFFPFSHIILEQEYSNKGEKRMQLRYPKTRPPFNLQDFMNIARRRLRFSSAVCSIAIGRMGGFLPAGALFPQEHSGLGTISSSSRSFS